MIDTLALTQIYYEIAMSIGNSLDLRKMLRESLSAYLRKLNCSAGTVLEMKQEPEGSFRFAPVFSIPHNAPVLSTCRLGLECAPETVSESELAGLREKLPIFGEDDRGRIFHLMELPGFGLLLLVRSAKPLEPFVIQSIERLNSKLANACVACLQNDRIERMNQELVQEIQHRKQVEAEMEKLLSELEQRVKKRTALLSESNMALAAEIRERRQMEQKVREQVDFLEILFDTIPNPIFHRDIKGRYTGCNRAFLEFSGRSMEEVLGKTIYDMRPREVADEWTRRDRELYEHPGKQHYEMKLQTKRGEAREIILDKATLLDAHGAVTGVLGVISDITDRKRTQNELLATNEQLKLAIARANEMAAEAERANMAKSEFLANMSHEIRTPMNGVIGMTCLLLDTELTEQQRQYAELVHQSSEALLSLINDILDFSKIEAQKLELDTSDFALRTTMEDTTEMLAVRAHEKDLELVCLIDPAVPSLLRGDPGRLRQVLVNLAGNAVKFTARGGVTIQVDLESEDEHSAVIRFSIKDTGIGIPAERLDAVFAPFTQVDGSVTRKYGGTGLGLTISKQLVELMGGRIGVESEEGKGSTFWFTVVFEKQPEDARLSVDNFADLQGVRVLVVDDHDTNRLLLTTLLRSWGCRFSEAADGEGALALLRAAVLEDDRYQVALLDMQMPEMSGEELGLRIKADPECQETILIVMTSLGQRGDAGRLRAAGFDAYLTKPLRQQQLRDCLALALGRKQGEQASAPASLITRHTVSEAQTRRVRILLAEDDSTNQQVALAFLGKLGYRADIVINGKEALEVLRTSPYDLVFMDCHMPEMDGYEATRCIRDPQSGVCNPAVPIIAMTARAMKGDREECLAAGMNDYISKPVSVQALADVLGKWVARDGEDVPSLSSPSPAEKPALLPPDSEEPAVPVFDKDDLLHRFMGDERLASVVIAGFLSDIPHQIKMLRDLVEEGKVESAGAQAHKIKGAAASVGGEALRALAFAMEKAGKDGDLAQLETLMPRVEEQFGLLKVAMES